MFDEKVAAHVAVYLLNKNGGSMSHLKLMKLMYLSERTSLKNFANIITGDRFFSMRHGPILSRTLDHMNDKIEPHPDGWADHISARTENEISIKDSVTERGDGLGYLCRANIETMDEVWEKFGNMAPYQLVDYTHKHCSEWENPHGSSRSIPIERVLCAVGYDKDEAKAITERIQNESILGQIHAQRGR